MEGASTLLNRLEKRCNEIGGLIKNDPSYVLTVRFNSLPKVPIVSHFNDTDEILPAKAAFLFYDNATQYLDLKPLGIVTTYLTEVLI